MGNLNTDFRPTSLKEVVGNKIVVGTVEKYLAKKNIPHSWLLGGHTGCGKTTLSRIIGHLIVGKYTSNCHEINSAEYRKVEDMRELTATWKALPIQGYKTVYIMDECHMLTKEAVNHLLKWIEDPPKHVYVILATTEPEKIKKTALNRRVIKLQMDALTKAEARRLISTVCTKFTLDIPAGKVVDVIYEESGGRAGDIVSLLQNVVVWDTVEEQLAALKSVDLNEESDEFKALMNALLWKPALKPALTAYKIVRKQTEPESLRRQIMGYADNVALGGNKQAVKILEALRTSTYDAGYAIITMAIFKITGGR